MDSEETTSIDRHRYGQSETEAGMEGLKKGKDDVDWQVLAPRWLSDITTHLILLTKYVQINVK